MLNAIAQARLRFMFVHTLIYQETTLNVAVISSLVWSAWYNGHCSATCGQGTMTRVRHCSTGHQADCQGSDREHVSCELRKCGSEQNYYSRVAALVLSLMRLITNPQELISHCNTIYMIIHDNFYKPRLKGSMCAHTLVCDKLKGRHSHVLCMQPQALKNRIFYNPLQLGQSGMKETVLSRAETEQLPVCASAPPEMTTTARGRHTEPYPVTVRVLPLILLWVKC